MYHRHLVSAAIALGVCCLTGCSQQRHTLTDPRDGQIYKTVKIGTQIWMAENLNYETPNSWWYADSPSHGDTYGRLYTWEAANTACPDGWHLWVQLDLMRKTRSRNE